MTRLTGLVAFEGPHPRVAIAPRHASLFEQDDDGRRRRDGAVHASGVTAVADARIDNADDLRRALGDGDAPTPAALFARLYERWGIDALGRVIGDFAVALWDSRAHRLVLARDAFGMRPLFYACAPGLIAFASSPAQLLDVPGVDTSPNLEFLGECIAGLFASDRDTIYRGITRVPAAHVVVASEAGVVVRRYWDIDPNARIEYARADEYAEEFRARLQQAVNARVCGHRRVAVGLSGGIDSSSVTGIASRAGVDLRAYSQVMRGLPQGDEQRYADAVARHCGIPLTIEPHAAASMDEYARRPAAAADWPHPEIGLAESRLRSTAVADGCTVWLDGTGGDEWFDGRQYRATDLIREGRWPLAVRRLRQEAALESAVHSFSALAAYAVWPLLPAGVRRAAKMLRRRPGGSLAPLRPDFVSRTGLADRARVQNFDRRFRSFASGAQYLSGTSPAGELLTSLEAQRCAAVGLEFAAPLMDRRLAEFAMAIPPEQRWDGGASKRIVRDAMRGLVPDIVLARRDKGSSSGAQCLELLRAADAGVFDRMRLAAHGIVDDDAVRVMIGSMRAAYARRDGVYKVLADRLWAVFTGEMVWRGLFEGGPRGARDETAGEAVGAAGAERQTAVFQAGAH